jgi:hypothetical protein
MSPAAAASTRLIWQTWCRAERQHQHRTVIRCMSCCTRHVIDCRIMNTVSIKGTLIYTV